jgi:hypothetical protein
MKSKSILVAVAAFLLLGGVLLLRPKPTEPPAIPPPKAPSKATPAPAATGAASAPKVPGLIRKHDGSSSRSDMLGIPKDPAKIADGIRERAFREYPAVVEKLKGPLTDDEREVLQRRKDDLPGEISEWTTELVSRKQMGYVDLFTEMLQKSPYFKMSAAEYLAAAGAEAPLLEGLNGTDFYARAAAGEALLPYLLERSGLSAGFRDGYRKVLKDDLSAFASSDYGANETGGGELGGRLRRAAVRLLTRFDDAGATALLLNLETRKDLVGWGPQFGEDVDAVYKHLARHGAPNDPPGMAEKLAAVVDAHVAAVNKPQEDPAGNPTSAALLLAALGLPQKLEELKTAYRSVFAQTAAQPDREFNGARQLLALRDATPVDLLIGQLTANDENLRNRAVTILSDASGQKIGTDRQLEGKGGGEDQARWAQVQQQWRDWWTAHRAEFQSTNPYKVR